MLTGVIPTGLVATNLTFPFEMIPAGTFYDNGTQIKPLIQWTIERMILAGVTRIFVTVTHHSQQTVMDYLEDGSRYLLPILYARPATNSLPQILDSLYEFIGRDTVVLIEPHSILKPPGIIQQAMTHQTSTQSDALTAKVGREAIYILTPAFLSAIREKTVESGQAANMNEALACARQKGLRVQEFDVSNGQSIQPLSPIWINQG